MSFTDHNVRDMLGIVRSIGNNTQAAIRVVEKMSRDELQQVALAACALAQSLAAELFKPDEIVDFLNYALSAVDERGT